MFKCWACGRNTVAGEKQHKVVVSKREKTYYKNVSQKLTVITPDGTVTETASVPTVEGYGWEIEAEAVYGSCCAKEGA